MGSHEGAEPLAHISRLSRDPVKLGLRCFLSELRSEDCGDQARQHQPYKQVVAIDDPVDLAAFWCGAAVEEVQRRIFRDEARGGAFGFSGNRPFLLPAVHFPALCHKSNLHNTI